MNWICLDGKMLPAAKPALRADNRGYRYGDGLFETMKCINGNIILEKLHFQRLFAGLKLLDIRSSPFFSSAKLKYQVLETCKKNKCLSLARVRLSVSRGHGGLAADPGPPSWLIEATALDRSVNRLNEKGWKIDIYPGIQKTCDLFSNIKSANFLPYVMAAGFARKQKLDDCLVTNIHGQIADATIANLFLVKNKLVITPALTEGCVNGVMRRYLIAKMKTIGYDVREGVVTKNDLETFDEVFLTNAINGIRWVKQFRNRKYLNTETLHIYQQLVALLYS